MEKTELLKQSSDTVFMEDQQQQHIPTYCIFFFKSTIYYMGLSGCEFIFFISTVYTERGGRPW